MPYNRDNVFAKILRGEAPCHRVYEDANSLAFMDIMPQVDGHVLVIPKQPAETLFELGDEELANCMRTVKRLSLAVKDAFDSPGISIVQVNGAAVGQTVPHVHFHIMPASILDVAKRAHAAVMEKPETLQRFAQRIVAVLPR